MACYAVVCNVAIGIAPISLASTSVCQRSEVDAAHLAAGRHRRGYRQQLHGVYIQEERAAHRSVLMSQTT